MANVISGTRYSRLWACAQIAESFVRKTYLPLSIGPVKAIIVFGAVNCRLLAGALMADSFVCDAFLSLFARQLICYFFGANILKLLRSRWWLK